MSDKEFQNTVHFLETKRVLGSDVSHFVDELDRNFTHAKVEHHSRISGLRNAIFNAIKEARAFETLLENANVQRQRVEIESWIRDLRTQIPQFEEEIKRAESDFAEKWDIPRKRWHVLFEAVRSKKIP